MMVNSFLANRNKAPEPNPVEISQADILAIQKAQEDLDQQDKQMKMREQRSQMMTAMYGKQSGIIDDSEMRALAEA